MFKFNKRKESSEEKPWSNSFEENSSESEMSRLARHAQSNDASLTTKVLLVVFIVMLLTPIIYYFYDSQQRTNAIESQSKNEVLISKEAVKEQQRVQSEKEEEARKAQQEREEQAERERIEAEELEAQKQKEAEQEAAAQEAAPPVTENVPEQSNQVTGAGYNNTYTVQAGDNLWRIAYNHGMTLEELKEVNGLPNNDAIIGMQLRVK